MLLYIPTLGKTTATTTVIRQWLGGKWPVGHEPIAHFKVSHRLDKSNTCISTVIYRFTGKIARQKVDKRWILGSPEIV